jgi:integrase
VPLVNRPASKRGWLRLWNTLELKRSTLSSSPRLQDSAAASSSRSAGRTSTGLPGSSACGRATTAAPSRSGRRRRLASATSRFSPRPRNVLVARKAEARYERPDDLIFGTSVGTPMDPNNWARREFRTAQQRAGLGEWVTENGKRHWAGAFRFHDLRHYAVSELIKQKADILLLARIAGHEDPSITLRVYSHLLNDDVSEASKVYDPLKRVNGRREVDAAPVEASRPSRTGFQAANLSGART